ncbi:MAG: hypothetical protein WD078_00365 [Woeseia sp.]
MNKRLGQTVVSVAFALLAGTTMAAEHSYDYAELRYNLVDIDDFGDGDGIELAGSVAVHENVHIFGSYEKLDYDGNVDSNFLQIGAGYMMPIATGADFVARLSYFTGDVDVGPVSFDDDGFGISAGVRKSFAQEFEGRVFLNHVDLDESGGTTSVEVAGDYFFNEQWAAGMGLEFGDDETVLSLGGRYYFGRMGRR